MIAALEDTTLRVAIFTATACSIAAALGLPYVPYGRAMFSSYVAALDVALVFLVFKGDVPLR